MKYWLMEVSSLVRRSFKISRTFACPFMRPLSSLRPSAALAGLAQRYRDSSRRAIRAPAAFGRAGREAGDLEHLVDHRAARAAAGSRSAGLAHLVHRPSAVRDRGCNVEVTGGLAEADVHGYLKITFKSKPVKSN